MLNFKQSISKKKYLPINNRNKMKNYFQIQLILLLSSVFLLTGFVSTAQTQPLPAMKFPGIPYKPVTTKGWVGQFVYELKFNDSTSVGKGKNRKYCHVIVNRVNSGFVELSMEVRGAIRSNQPDKNNTQRYESWINSGTKNCWSRHDETDTLIEPSGTMLSDGATTGRLEKFSRYTSGDTWVKGWIENTDLQIDYTTGKYSFAVPLVTYNLEGDETIVDINYKPAKKDVKPRKEKKTHGLINIPFFTYGNWNMLEGSFKEGQKEIVIRERIPITLILNMLQGTKTIAAPSKKGFIDFYLVLKKLPYNKDEKSVAAGSTPDTEAQKAPETTDAQSTNTKKKTGLSGIKNKINSVIRNQ